METKSDLLRKQTCAYTNNSFQGPQKRLLFVCTMGLLRSPTCADVATSMGFNSRSCGSSIHEALIPISANLIVWADSIIFLNSHNKIETVKNFEEYAEMINKKSFVFNIDDDYERNDVDLIRVAKQKIESNLC